MTLKKAIQAFLLICVSATAITLATGLFLGPDRTITWLRKAIPGASGLDRFDALVTADKIIQVFIYLAGLLVLMLSLLLIVSRRFTEVRGFLKDLQGQAVGTLQVLQSPAMALTLVIPASAAIYYAATLPVSQDEALTYLFFTSRNAVVAYTYYPFPNNHILHSILTTFTKHLPFSVLFNMRIPSILAQMATWLIALRLLSRMYGKKYAILAVSLASMLFLNVYYSYQSRGYALINLSFIASLGCVLAITSGSRNRWLWHYLTLFSTIGFAAMPSFLYPFATMHVILLWHIRKVTIAQVASGLGTVILTVLFYAPVIIVNGTSALSGNAYVAPAPRQEVLRELPRFLEQLLAETVAMHWIWVAALLTVAMAYLFLLGSGRRKADAVIWMVSIPMCILAHSVIPFPRTFVYAGLLSAMLIAGMTFPLFLRWPLSRATAFGIFLQAMLLVRFHHVIEPYEERDPQINFTASRIIGEIAGPDRRYLCSGALLGTNLLFEIKAKNINGSQVIFEDRAVSADTCTAYDYVIAGNQLDSTRLMQPVFQNAYYAVYRTKRKSH